MCPIGTNAIICGGYTFQYPTDECYVITAKKSKLVVKMSEERDGAASVTINKTLLWVSGGKNNDYDILSSSEFIGMDRTIPGPNLTIGKSKCYFKISPLDENPILFVLVWTQNQSSNGLSPFSGT